MQMLGFAKELYFMNIFSTGLNISDKRSFPSLT